MRIFISHSGDRSRAIAATLNDWLKRVIQAVEPFYSQDIEKGSKWMEELRAALKSTGFGIVCLTPDNLQSEWIHYEVGALAQMEGAKIWTFLHGVKFLDVPLPLGDFQHTEAKDKEDVLKMLQSINKRLADVGGKPLDPAFLKEMFDLQWPSLEAKLKEIEKLSEPGSDTAKRSEEEILSEILYATRSQEQALRVLIDAVNNAYEMASFAAEMASVNKLPRPGMQIGDTPRAKPQTISLWDRIRTKVNLESMDELADESSDKTDTSGRVRVVILAPPPDVPNTSDVIEAITNQILSSLPNTAVEILREPNSFKVKLTFGNPLSANRFVGFASSLPNTLGLPFKVESTIKTGE